MKKAILGILFLILTPPPHCTGGNGDAGMSVQRR